MSVIGYARVSTREQNPQAQEAELRDAGATKVFTDHGESSRTAARPQWQACLDYLRPGDVLLVRKLDRLAGTERMVIEVIHSLDERGVDIKSLTEPQIDTTTAMGKALFGVVAVFAQLRVDTIRENTKLGLEHARKQGRVGGRPTVISDDKVELGRRMRAAGASYTTIGQAAGVSKTTAYRMLTSHSETP